MALGFFSRLKDGLAKSTQKLTGGISAVITRRKLDDAALAELEETLIAADLGPAAAEKIIASFRRTRFGKDVTDAEVRAALAEEIAAILAPVARPLIPDPTLRPHVILVAGVNGTGKAAPIGKLARLWRDEGLRSGLVAGERVRGGRATADLG